ncbi:MAG: hypothetical protein KAI26_05060 [Nanoarchaeota archaeon]|nr:hypothetical protein [Nanoarchaeota archaeon]
MTFARKIEKCIKDLETQKQRLKNGLGISNKNIYLKILHEYLEYLGKLMAEEIEEIYEKNKSGKYNIIPGLNTLRDGINLWYQYEANVLKSEILLEERGVAQENFKELDRMKVKMDIAVKDYPNYDLKIIQNQVTVLLLKGDFSMRASTNRIRVNIEKL